MAKNPEGEPTRSWTAFDTALEEAPQLGQISQEEPMKLGLFFPRPEIVPSLPAGNWLFDYTPSRIDLERAGFLPAHESFAKVTRRQIAWDSPKDLVRATVESQLLSCRLRACPVLEAHDDLPPQPRRIYVVGGAAMNEHIVKAVGEVLGGTEGVYRLDAGGNACALGSAYRAAWTALRPEGESFEDFVAQRWREEDFVKRVDVGYRPGVFEKYGEAVFGYSMMEKEVMEMVSVEHDSS